ncbi:hypothetical protein H8356DRAFT_926610 [Neocallimastix lanati (nom. inval.)]|nr:hypothetical protein H8356DRAFT_926610 [Neocallimastix sp. JGI-2020a]
MDSLEYLDNNYQEPCDTSTISSNSIPLPSPTYTPSIISKNSISLSKSNTSSDISYDNLNNSIVKDHDLFLSSSPSSLDDISNDDISLEDSFQEIKEKKKKDDVLLESSLPIVQYQAKTPQPIEKPNVITINSVINNNNNNNGKKDNANHTGKGIINNKLPSTSSNKKDSASVRFNFNNNLDIKNYSESDDDIERIEKNSIEFLTNEHGFIKTFINLSLDECDECNPVERKIAEKLLDKQLPLLKNYENTILSIETFMDKIIEDLKKYKSRENSKLKKSNDINTELDSKLKKSNDINTELDQNYQNLKEYSNSIMRENADLQQIIEKCRNYIEQLEKSDKDNSNKVKRDEEDYVKEIERRMNEERVKIIKEERERLIREESRKINEEEREKIRKEERNKLNDIYEKLKGEEIENLKRELDVLREEKESAIKREREKLKMVRNERIMAETEKIKQEELELINMERDKMRRESKERLREEMEKLREEEMKILNEEREKLKAGEMQILNVEREKLKEEEMKILNEEREKLKNDEIIILNRERERIRSEEREKIRKEEKERFKKKERLRKEMEKERNIITGKNKMKEAESEDNSNANDNSNNIKLTSTDHLPDKEENYLTDIDIIEQDISNIFSSTSNTIQKAILMYDYLFKENLKPYDSYSSKY